MKNRLAMMLLLGGVMFGATANASTLCVCVGTGGSAGGSCGNNAIGGNFGQYFSNVSSSDLTRFLRKNEAKKLKHGSSTREYSSQTGWLCTKGRR